MAALFFSPFPFCILLFAGLLLGDLPSPFSLFSPGSACPHAELVIVSFVAFFLPFPFLPEAGIFRLYPGEELTC